MPVLEHIFFDLDKTLWNHTANIKLALHRLYGIFIEELQAVPLEEFCNTFISINDVLWQRFSEGKIDGPHLRYLRFKECMQDLGIHNNNLARRLSRKFLEIAPYGKILEEGALDLLFHFNTRYHLHIITNGFYESQVIKLKSSGIRHYFKTITTSDHHGFRKPDIRIFKAALKKAGALPENSAYVGDDWLVDIVPAIQLGFRTFWYKPDEPLQETLSQQVTVINSLIQLQEILNSEFL